MRPNAAPGCWGGGVVGRLRAPVACLLADPETLAAAARLLLDGHFTPVLAELICAAVDLDVAAPDLAGSGERHMMLVSGSGAAGSPRDPARPCLPVRDDRRTR